MNPRPLGLFGGMFDPVHFGHLHTAAELREVLDLEAVMFIPAGEPPHRRAPRASAAERLAMLQAAAGEMPGFQVDGRELGRAGPSYTVLTLGELRAERGAQPLALIVGQDAYAGIGGWHRASELIGLAHIVIAARPGTPLPAEGLPAEWLAARRCSDAAALTEAPAGRVYLHQGTQLDLSSSDVRAVVAAGRDARYLMPASVRRIISATGIYARPGSAEG